ncbi:HTTM domain-containing protein, partial [Streptomyces sp. SID4985]|nr:HTTM domain-containing protein [Streptomyces sp. SID4985]
VGPVLWAVSGAALVAVALTDGFGATWPVPTLLWATWAGLGLWWAAGRRARSPEPRMLLDVIANVLHNGALVVIMAEACLIYATAGWYKIQGSRWQDGTAVYYPLHLDYFSPWPALAGLMAASGTLMMLAAYGTVMMQVAFPFTLFNRRVKNVLLVLMMAEHAAIAVLLGLPFFSLAMITADAVFLPTAFLLLVGGGVARARARLFRRGGRPMVPGPRVPEDDSAGRVGFTA